MIAPAFTRFIFGAGEDVGTISTGPARIERRHLGSLDVPDGRVYACDPLAPLDQQPFAQRVSPGTYAVVLFVAVRTESNVISRFASSLEVNVAAALLFTTEPPVSWKRAAREGGAPDTGAYGVDSGTGCLMGKPAATRLFDDDDRARSTVSDSLREAANIAKGGGIVTLEAGASVAAFVTGSGDGAYDSWWGHAANDEVSLLVTDFDVLLSAAEVSDVHAQWAKRAAKRWWQVWK